MNRHGKILLILDGFDEMARQVDYQTVVDNFWQLADLVDEGSKVILTSRTEYFRWAKESEKILAGKEFGRRTILLSPPKFEVLNIEPFGDNQIIDALTRRLGNDKGPIIARRILDRPDLAEMIRKPVLLELLLAALDEVGDNILENPAQVYLYATNKLLLRNIDTKRTFTTTSDKLFFLCELAWEMIKNNQLTMHYKSIPERIKLHFGNRIIDQHELDTWDFDLRNQTLLHRNAAGYYEFAHKSLAEYFVAFKLAAELGCMDETFAKTYCEENHQPCRIPIESKEINKLNETFGALPLFNDQMLAVYNLLKAMISKGSSHQLWKIVYETRCKKSKDTGYIGCNAITLLQSLNDSFIGATLADTVLTSVELRNQDLSNIDAHNADLTNAKFIKCKMEKINLEGCNLQSSSAVDSDFTKANLIKANLENVTFVNCVMVEADLEQCNLMNSNLEGIDFSNANLINANFENVRLSGCNFKGAKLEGCNFKNSRFYNMDFDISDLNKANIINVNIINKNLDELTLISEGKIERVRISRDVDQLTEAFR